MSHFTQKRFGKRGVNVSLIERTSEVTRYLDDVNNIPALTSEESEELMYQIKNGDKEAKERYIKANLPLVISVVKNNYNEKIGSFSFMDLVSIGNIGLIKAIEGFDPTKGFAFSTYAVPKIRAEINNELQYTSRLVSDYHKGAIVDHSSLDAPIDHDDATTTLGDVICTTTDAEHCAKESLFTDLMRTINSILGERESNVICMVFGIGTEPKSLWEIARDWNLTEERIRQIKESGLQKMRENGKAITLLAKYK